MKKRKTTFKGHGNRKINPEPHHLYEIRDAKDDSLVKYGISCDPIETDNYSYRMRRQVTIGNAFVGWLRFFARVLIRNIPGRKRAEQIEQTFINNYEEKHGQRPRGNF